MYDYVNELLKEYQILVNVIIFFFILWWSLRHIGNRYMKLSEDKERLTERLEERLSDLELNERIKTSEEYDRKEEIIRSSYDRGLRNLYDDYKSLHLTFIYQGIWVIGSLLFVIVLIMLDL